MFQHKPEKCILSVVVPVYNIREYVEACLKSLCTQEFAPDEYEILCVNDGSTDGSETIVQSLMGQYPQIRLIEQKNQGVSAARNTGIEQARGEYLFFCDGDDFLEPHCLKKIVELCRARNADSVSFGFRTVPENAEPHNSNGESDITWTAGKNKPFYSGNIWRFVFRRELITKNNIRFKVGMKYAEDELFIYHVCRFLNFDEHIYINEVLYNYRMRSTSAVHKKKEIRLREHYVDMVEMAKEYRLCLASDTLSHVLRVETKKRMQYAVSNALQDALIIGERKPKAVLDELRQNGLYPYGLNFRMLRITDTKTMLVNYMKFFYPCAQYYIGVYRIRQILKSKSIY